MLEAKWPPRRKSRSGPGLRSLTSAVFTWPGPWTAWYRAGPEGENATLPQGRPSSRRQADCRNRHWTDQWHRPLYPESIWLAFGALASEPTHRAEAGASQRQAAHEEFAAGVPLPLLWIGHGWRTSQGSRAAAAAPP